MFSIFKKNKKKCKNIEKEDLALDAERKEAEKWLKIAQNVANYDGTAKGQIKI